MYVESIGISYGIDEMNTLKQIVKETYSKHLIDCQTNTNCYHQLPISVFKDVCYQVFYDDDLDITYLSVKPVLYYDELIKPICYNKQYLLGVVYNQPEFTMQCVNYNLHTCNCDRLFLIHDATYIKRFEHLPIECYRPSDNHIFYTINKLLKVLT